MARESHSTLVPILSEVTATTTSSAYNIEGARKVMLIVKRADHSAGSSAFTAEVSVDAVNYIDYDKWIDNVANTNSQQLTRIKTKTLSSNGTDCVAMSPEDGFKWIRVKVTETTDGTHSAWLYLEY